MADAPFCPDCNAPVTQDDKYGWHCTGCDAHWHLRDGKLARLRKEYDVLDDETVTEMMEGKN